MVSTDALDPSEYLREHDEINEKREEFMCKQLRRTWPLRIVCVLGIVQLLISLGMVGVDLPIILMFAPRWEVFAGCWAFIFAFITSVSTLHSTRKITWLKLKWAVGLNILGGLAAAVMVAFDILFLVNSKICVAIGGCNYLSYTYSSATSLYVGEVVLGILFLISVFFFLILSIKYGVGGIALFGNIVQGLALDENNYEGPSDTANLVQQPPAPGSGIRRGKPSSASKPRPQYQTGAPGMVMAQPRAPMRMPGPRGPMPGNYGQQLPFPPGAYQPGGYPPGAYQPGGYPPGTYAPGGYPPGTYPPGAYQPGAYPPGAYPPGAYPPGGYPPGAYPPSTRLPVAYPQGMHI